MCIKWIKKHFRNKRPKHNLNRFNHVQSPKWKSSSCEAEKYLAQELLTCKLGARLRFHCRSEYIVLLLFCSTLYSSCYQKPSHSVLPSLSIRHLCEGNLLLFIALVIGWLASPASARRHAVYSCKTIDFKPASFTFQSLCQTEI